MSVRKRIKEKKWNKIVKEEGISLTHIGNRGKRKWTEKNTKRKSSESNNMGVQNKDGKGRKTKPFW